MAHTWRYVGSRAERSEEGVKEARRTGIRQIIIESCLFITSFGAEHH